MSPVVSYGAHFFSKHCTIQKQFSFTLIHELVKEMASRGPVYSCRADVLATIARDYDTPVAVKAHSVLREEGCSAMSKGGRGGRGQSHLVCNGCRNKKAVSDFY